MRSLLALFVVGLAGTCRGNASCPPVPAVTSVSTAASTAPKTTSPVLEVSPPHAVIDDPRLARVKARENARDYAGAARALIEARDGGFRDPQQPGHRLPPAELSTHDRCAWAYIEGRLDQFAGAWADAALAFEKVADAGCPLAPYANLRSAQAFAREGHSEEAIVRARAVPADLASYDEAQIVIAEALAAKGDTAGAVPLWRAWLGANPRGSRWVDTSISLATALLDGKDGDPASHAREAFDLAERVVLDAPRLADSVNAAAVRTRAVALLRKADPHAAEQSLTDLERARRAQGFLDAGDPARALAEAGALTAKGPGAASCKAAITRATAAARVAHGVSADAWGEAIALCDQDEQLATALYSGAKASTSKRPKEAIERYAKIEQRFPKHHLADDARLHGAVLVQQMGDAQRATAMLRALPDDYPQGDMRTEALFRVALAAMQQGDWAGASEPLDRILAIEPNDRHYATAARAAYFRARAAARTGDSEGARSRYLKILTDYPLVYYMTQAYARVAEDDSSLAARAIEEAARRDAEGTFPSKEHAILAQPGVRRGVALLEVGELDAAKREFSASGALADSVDPEVVWTIGLYYERAGAPELGHAFARGRLTDFLAHYPVGKWKLPWEIAFPRAFEPLVSRESASQSIPAPLTWAIMREESSFYADARSGSNAFGLMQLIVPTAKWTAVGSDLPFDEVSLRRPEVSIALGTRLLSKLRQSFANPAFAICAYNGGGGSVNKWVAARATDDFDLFLELVPWDETRNYAKRVLGSQAAYAYLYDRPSLAEVLALPAKVAR